jgi:hypothetical protein
MPDNVFDANVLVYIASGDPAKADRAEAIIGNGGVMSVQVLNELTNVARRKMLLSWPEIRRFLSVLRSLLTVQPITVETRETGPARPLRAQPCSPKDKRRRRRAEGLAKRATVSEKPARRLMGADRFRSAQLGIILDRKTKGLSLSVRFGDTRQAHGTPVRAHRRPRC